MKGWASVSGGRNKGSKPDRERKSHSADGSKKERKDSYDDA